MGSAQPVMPALAPEMQQAWEQFMEVWKARTTQPQLTNPQQTTATLPQPSVGSPAYELPATAAADCEPGAPADHPHQHPEQDHRYPGESV